MTCLMELKHASKIALGEGLNATNNWSFAVIDVRKIARLQAAGIPGTAYA